MISVQEDEYGKYAAMYCDHCFDEIPRHQIYYQSEDFDHICKDCFEKLYARSVADAASNYIMELRDYNIE